MKSKVTGEQARNHIYSVKVHATSYSSTSCALCWFFLTIYPTLEGMAQKDKALFAEHLKKSHGLSGEIRQ